jgi:hypothetical protein
MSNKTLVRLAPKQANTTEFVHAQASTGVRSLPPLGVCLHGSSGKMKNASSHYPSRTLLLPKQANFVSFILLRMEFSFI